MDTKVCSKCGCELPVSDFNRDRSKADGLFSSCKECRKGVTSSYYAEHREEIKDRVRDRARGIALRKKVEREAYELEHADELRAQREERLEARREAKRQRERDRYNADPEAAKQRCREYRRKNPLKQAARSKVTYAIKMGRLLKQPCEVCGCGEVEAHHDDYSKPLEVRWLCSKHHGEFHTQDCSEGKAYMVAYRAEHRDKLNRRSNQSQYPQGGQGTP